MSLLSLSFCSCLKFIPRTKLSLTPLSHRVNRHNSGFGKLLDLSWFWYSLKSRTKQYSLMVLQYAKLTKLSEPQYAYFPPQLSAFSCFSLQSSGIFISNNDRFSDLHVFPFMFSALLGCRILLYLGAPHAESVSVWHQFISCGVPKGTQYPP